MATDLAKMSLLRGWSCVPGDPECRRAHQRPKPRELRGLRRKRRRRRVYCRPMVTPRTVIVVNPRSQGGRLGKRWKDIADTIRRAFPFEEAITQAPGDATRLA